VPILRCPTGLRLCLQPSIAINTANAPTGPILIRRSGMGSLDLIRHSPDLQADISILSACCAALRVALDLGSNIHKIESDT
jgi:hypothetical protein